MRRASLIAVLLLAAGCGRERLPVPDVDRAAVTGDTTKQAYPQAGLRFDAPAGWGFARGQAPLVASTSNGSATIAIWRYERTEPLPERDAALQTAERALLDTVRQRDRTYREVSTERTEVGGEPAIELVGEQRVANRPRRVRSTHVFAHGAELVIDQYAAPTEFDRLDAAVFQPLVQSLEIDEPTR